MSTEVDSNECAVCPVIELAATDPARAVHVGMTMGNATPREQSFDQTFKLCTRCRVGLLRVVESHNAHFHGARR